MGFQGKSEILEFQSEGESSLMAVVFVVTSTRLAERGAIRAGT